MKNNIVIAAITLGIFVSLFAFAAAKAVEPRYDYGQLEQMDERIKTLEMRILMLELMQGKEPIEWKEL